MLNFSSKIVLFILLIYHKRLSKTKFWFTLVVNLLFRFPFCLTGRKMLLKALSVALESDCFQKVMFFINNFNFAKRKMVKGQNVPTIQLDF